MVSGLLLNVIKESVQEKIEDDMCRNCVVTIPAYFEEYQIKATEEACKIAGMKCQKMIEEPVAAALYYIFGRT